MASDIMEGDREVISNSRWGTGWDKTGRRVIPRIIIRRHVLGFSWFSSDGGRQGRREW